MTIDEYYDKSEYEIDWPGSIHLYPKIPPKKIFWTGIGVNFLVESGSSSRHDFSPDFHFRPQWLIVTTSGFQLDLKAKNINIINNVDADAYYRTNWDKLERLGQLEKVRLSFPVIGPADKVCFYLKNRMASKPTWFRANLIGLGLSPY